MNRERTEARMTDREALAAALGERADQRSPNEHQTVDDAAEERLAQLPEKCEICDGTGWIPVESDDPLDDPCPTCHGSGKVYPAELVERVATVFLETIGYLSERDLAVAVLDALNGETE